MSKENIWIIAPTEGVLPVRFGDTLETVASITQLGEIEKSMPSEPDTITEFRALNEPTISYRDDQVFYIAVGHRTPNVKFGKVDVFGQEPRLVLQAFEAVNGSPGFVQLGQVVFEALNVTLEGFYLPKEDAFYDPASLEQDDRLIILNAPGTLDVFDNLPKTMLSFF